MSTKDCTVRETNGWGPDAAARSRFCGWVGYRTIATTCRCGHTGTTVECEEHAKFPVEDRFCHACNSEGHSCPVTIVVVS